jgi:predicted PilT family ATPase
VAQPYVDGIDAQGFKSLITNRRDSVEMIHNLLQTQNVVLIHGPPYSGKTSLSQLLEDFYKVWCATGQVLR